MFVFWFVDGGTGLALEGNRMEWEGKGFACGDCGVGGGSVMLLCAFLFFCSFFFPSVLWNGLLWW